VSETDKVEQRLK